MKLDIASTYPITAEQVRFYQDHGYLRLKGVFSPEVLDHYRTEINKEVERDQKIPLENDDAYAKAFSQVMNIWERNATVREFAFSKRIAHIAAALLRASGVRIYHDQALRKEPGGGMTPWHADQYYFPITSDKAVTAWIPLQATPREMGPLEFAAKSHKDDLTGGRTMGISKDSEAKIQQAVAEGGYQVAGGAFELGEVSFHAGWTFHRAAGNRTDRPREVFTVIYIDEDMTMAEPINDNQRADHDRWLPGVKPGEVCASARNPVIWSSKPHADTKPS